ncbi:acyl-CoA/acyl-ACP dehydrogenase [Spongiibacter taiwanensis]|uniref:acyl-CoA dehydrogenase family protein n=1 Tax=Spongiibacter taiwanensis TaxID=1748242 RepID=UPI002034FC68|nr:acyl-CoA dehydrogenase family protein [Spongiibacter taiwanensis]USA42599.1 acyl-CoA/acyl-ACP dehydrogenase [Spongiibacter taiwanensis]
MTLASLPQTAAIQASLAQLREHLASVTGALAQQCASKGKLDSARLDGRQVASFELAWANAELLAAEQALTVWAGSSDELEMRLSAIFIAEAMTLLRDRLEAIELDVDDTAVDALGAIFNGAAPRALRKLVLGDQFLQDTAELMAQHPERIAKVSLNEDLGMVQDMFRRFAADEVAPLAEEIHRQDLIVPEDKLLKPLREMGVFGLSIPEQYGGSAPNDRDDNMTMVVVTEALSEASLAAAGSLITRPEILSRALLSGGTEAQKQAWLPRIAQGQPLCGIAITEPDYGSDVASLKLKGTKTEGGWLLNGAKTWCTFAGKAGVMMVVTRTDPDTSKGYRGLSLLLAEKPSFDGHDFDHTQEGGGRIVGRAIPTIGYRGMHSFDVSFENYFVPDANVIGEEGGLGKGFYYTMAGMMGGRMQTAARASGVMRAALLAALRYAQERKVFGQPLLEYSLTASKLARMGARYAASRYLAYAVARILDAGGGRMEASLVKLFACRSAEIITREALQIHGGMGYAEEMPVSRYFVDARVLSIFEGAEETLALKVIARSLLEGALQEDAA